MKLKNLFFTFLIFILLVSCYYHPIITSIAPPETEHKENTGFKYDHVILIGVDAMGAYCDNTPTPNMDRIFKDGAKASDVYVYSPTKSAQGWGSILHGVDPQYHGMTNNLTDGFHYPSPTSTPSVFKVISDFNPDANLVEVVSWHNLTTGMVEENLPIHQECYEENDKKVLNRTLALLEKETPTFMFTYFVLVDAALHEYGAGSPEHLQMISLTDNYIGQIYDKIVEKGEEDSTLFIVATDHGGKLGKDHGGDSKEEKYVFTGIKGKTINPESRPADTLCDIASIITYALGVPTPSTWQGVVPDTLFVDSSNK